MKITGNEAGGQWMIAGRTGCTGPIELDGQWQTLPEIADCHSYLSQL
jgi:hypothetical protein